MATGTISYNSASFSDQAATHGATVSATVTSVPSDIGSVTAVSKAAGSNNLTQYNDGSNDDEYGLQIRIMADAGATVLAAGNSSGAFTTISPVVVHNNALGGESLSSSVKNFGYVNTAAGQSSWDTAYVEYYLFYIKNMASDVGYFDIQAETSLITLTYTPAVAGGFESAWASGSNQIL